MNFYKSLGSILQESSIDVRSSQFEHLYSAYLKGETSFETHEDAMHFEHPSYSAFCSIIDPKNVPKRKRLSTQEGRKIFIHAIMHIEYSAFDLALDACYRFRNLPKAYYDDWLSVAHDEMRHFLMLQEIASTLGTYYGEYEVHDALFEASRLTTTLLERMAVVPRFMEANGLDANPRLIKKLRPFQDEAIVKEMIQALELILKEEIDHVHKGDRWFKYACDVEHKEYSVYFDIIKKYYPRTFPRMHEVNVQARKEAGFSCDELKQITSQECE